ncbi:HNH/ENDO VII family nuclease [Paraliobacillus sp. JSM ZJ581]
MEYLFASVTSFDMYKTTKSLQVIKNTEYGIYGLISANGFSEYLTGKDILGNDLTTSQRQASLSLGLAGMLPTAIELTPASKAVTKDITKKAHERVVRNTQSARSFVDHWFNGLVSQTDVAMAGGPRLPIHAMRDTHVQQEIHTSFAKVTKSTGKEYKNYKAVEYTGTTKVNGEVRDISRRVFQRIDIDYKRIDPDSGMTNFQLMKKGRAPIWKGGTVIELHHLIQREPGSMVEIPASMHDEYNKILHGLVENDGSFRNDPVLKKQYDNFRSKYWRWRAKQIDKSDL